MKTPSISIVLALALLSGAPPIVAQSRPPAVAPRAPVQGPFEVLLANRTQLELTDAQVHRILEIRAGVEERNAPLVARLVAMRRALGPREAPRAMSRRDRLELRERVQAARPLIAQIRANNRAGMRAVGAVLTEGQKEGLRRLVRQRRERGRAPDGPPGAHGLRG